MSVNDVNTEGCCKMRMIEYHNYKTLLGPCFVSFSVPLLVPGVVLTVVGSIDNDVTFARFSGWHIAGIAILTFALVLLLVGIILKCCIRPVLSADIEKHLTPRSSRVTGSRNLGYENDTVYSGNLRSTKVGHHDGGGDRVVSTHEKKESSTSNADKQRTVKQSGNPSASANGTTNKQSTTDGAKHKGLKANGQNKHPMENQRPQALSADLNPSKGSQVPVKVSHIKPSLTPRPDMDATHPFSDPAENISFLPEEKPKKRKKKKKRRQRDLSPHTATDDINTSISVRTPHERPNPRELSSTVNADDSTMLNDDSQVPVATSLITSEGSHEAEAGVPQSVLMHSGEQHDYHDLHVHFHSAPEAILPEQIEGDS